ncbi:pyridine nucleotide-disulfide oxidoreductase [Tersicoccus phoenicis]|uniref:Pyridine nucleotide-disulfide oxidoreductase n=1 Tax=Tersicoccus phoenicis TaxID=554083 RepID=A0A1R1LGQ1_9MICC|nr:FAD-dependent oxidoreductase [Tersicoccus phoenicis]OMH26707.1 pyridine nucleotide-disulfide oxidoreductase [Tersicoccus phoenicis]
MTRFDPLAHSPDDRLLDVVVIGAGQAGLSAAHHLLRSGLRSWDDVVVLDANDGPGGAWRHRWDSLTLGAAHGIHDLPGLPLGTPDPTEPASRVVARYYGAYEGAFELPVMRPVAVASVDQEPDGVFTVTARDGRRWRTRAVVNATGTWDSPYVPRYPGIASFIGRQLHTRDYTAATDFTGRRVLVVGGGTSAAQFVLELHRAGVDTVWSTRKAPHWTDRAFDQDWGRDVESAVTGRTVRGLAPLSVVAATGLPLSRPYVAAIESGRLISRGPLRRLTPTGAVLTGPGPDGHGVPSQGAADRLIDDDVRARVPALPGHPVPDGEDGWEVPIDVVLWATGFRASLGHLSPLHLREPGGGIVMETDGVTVPKRPGLFLVGYGASASTLGATRAGRRAARAAVRFVSRPAAEDAGDAKEDVSA